MIKTLTIKNFKKFEQIKFEDLQQFNIFLGVNNVGKTTILEAIMGFASGQYYTSVFNLSIIDRLRNQVQGLNAYQLAEVVLNTFHNFNSQSDLSFSFKGKVDNGINKAYEKEFIHKFEPGQFLAPFLPDKKVIMNDMNIITQKVQMPFSSAMGTPVTMDIPSQFLGEWKISSGKESKAYKLVSPYTFNQFSSEKPFITAVFHDIIAHRNIFEFPKIYSSLMTQGLLGTFIDELNSAFSGLNIKSIDNIPYPDGTQAPISFSKKDGSRYPFYTLGDGVQRWFSLLGLMIAYPDSVHCIEEADVTLHHQAQDGFAVNLKNITQKYNNQVFMSTHNVEFLKTFLIGMGKDNPDFLKKHVRVVTLRDYKTGPKQRTLHGFEALEAINNGLELRI